MLSSRDVSWWLYLLIGVSIVVTFLLTNKVLDKIATPSLLLSPKILSTHPGSRNIHHIALAPAALGPEDRKSSSAQETPLSTKIARAIAREKAFLAEDLAGLESVHGEPLDSLVMAEGGQPVRALVTTTWRSGSTFLGDIMTAHPGTFYHYEPLLHYDIVQARSGALAQDAVRTIKDLMHCNYTNLNRYLTYGRGHQWLFTHNARLWTHCQADGKQRFQKSYCWKPEFLNKFCPLFPFQSIKTVRLRLNLTEQLVKDPSLNVRVMLLVRDPRGTMESRKHRDWCPHNPDCEDPAKLCQDLVDDYHSLRKLLRQHPDRYKVFRYEDFSMNPYNNTRDVFNFFGFTMHSRVSNFLDTHTKANIGGVSSTFRDSKTAPFKWRERLSEDEVYAIQDKCTEAMTLWGYKSLTEKEDLKTFEPVYNLEHFTLGN